MHYGQCSRSKFATLYILQGKTPLQLLVCWWCRSCQVCCVPSWMGGERITSKTFSCQSLQSIQSQTFQGFSFSLAMHHTSPSSWLKWQRKTMSNSCDFHLNSLTFFSLWIRQYFERLKGSGERNCCVMHGCPGTRSGEKIYLQRSVRYWRHL